MYFWNVNALVDDFRNNRVTQKEELKYFIAFSIVIVIATNPIGRDGVSYTYYDTAMSVIVLIATLVGTYYCYKVNSGGDNASFITRMICLGWPVGIRLLALAFIFYIGLGIGMEVFTGQEQCADDEFGSYQMTLVDVIFTAVFEVAFYYYLAYSIAKVSRPPEKIEPVPV